MILSALVSALHIFGVALALGSAFMRGVYLRGTLDTAQLKRVFMADNIWGLSAVVVIGSGLARAFAGLEKGSQFYLQNPIFHAKLTFLAALLALEALPMATFVQWRIAMAKNKPLDLRRQNLFIALNTIEVVILLAMLVTASLMARGIGLGLRTP